LINKNAVIVTHPRAGLDIIDSMYVVGSYIQ